MALVHHELCFGCGRVNLFGLLMELEPSDDGALSGRCFIKQDHQGPDRRNAHAGIVATALTEAMALACGRQARANALEIAFIADVPVGEYLELSARAATDGAGLKGEASASHNGQVVARASGSYD